MREFFLVQCFSTNRAKNSLKRAVLVKKSLFALRAVAGRNRQMEANDFLVVHCLDRGLRGGRPLIREVACLLCPYSRKEKS